MDPLSCPSAWQTAELQALRHRVLQEARSRQEQDACRARSLQQMRDEAEDRESQLRTLSEQLDRGSRMSQLQRQRSGREMRQVWMSPLSHCVCV